MIRRTLRQEHDSLALERLGDVPDSHAGHLLEPGGPSKLAAHRTQQSMPLRAPATRVCCRTLAVSVAITSAMPKQVARYCASDSTKV